MKKLQVLEPMHSGHHTNYLLSMIPAIEKLQQDKIVGSAVFTVTPKHLQLLEESGEVQRAGAIVEWDGTLAQTSPGPSMKERKSLYESVRKTVDACHADALICTSADYDVIPNASASLHSDKRYWPTHSAAVIHYGLPKTGLSFKENIKRMTYELAWKFSNWNQLLVVNPLVYESLQSRGKTTSNRFQLLPDPVPVEVELSRTDARAALGVPLEGPYIGCVGMMDHRKAIPELLSAFARSGLASEARLLLAGRLDGRYKQILDRDHAALIEAGRIVVIDRSLTDQELMCGYAAVDLHAVLQYRRMNLSANALKCVAFGRPFLSDQHGFTAMVAERFQAGVVCDVENIDSIAAALARGLELSKHFTKSDSMRRLIEFHSYGNFAGIALSSVLGPAVLPSLGPSLGWDYAYGSALGQT
jgi:glycosyltransferase involved in cell wall biosynthesis